MMNQAALSLTPEQIAAVTAGGGLAEAIDPATEGRYLLVQRCEAPPLEDDYFREKTAAAIASLARGEGRVWDVDDLKAKLAERLRQRLA